MLKVALLTLGCKVNQAEITEMEQALRARGHQVVELDESPDVCVVNTCTVTAKSDLQSRQIIRRAGRTGARVIVTGCYADLNPSDVLKIDSSITLVGNREKTGLIRLIDSDIRPGPLTAAGEARTRYFLKVQDGCDFSCSYCVIWKARGRSRSRTVAEVVEHAQQVEVLGYREIVLTGIHLGLYDDDSTRLAGLVRALLDATSLCRFRLSSLEVNEVDDSLVDLMKTSGGRLCPHLHIPLQSGSDRVLKDMNRGYTAGQFRDRVLGLVERVPGIAIGTDIIAGYPTEGEDEFRQSAELMASLPFAYAHVFPYSSRPLAASADLPDHVGHPERKRRADVLRGIGNKAKLTYNNKQMGELLEVLVENRRDNVYIGKSENYIIVEIYKSPSGIAINRGDLKTVSISSTSGDRLVGTPYETRNSLI